MTNEKRKAFRSALVKLCNEHRVVLGNGDELLAMYDLPEGREGLDLLVYDVAAGRAPEWAMVKLPPPPPPDESHFAYIGFKS